MLGKNLPTNVKTLLVILIIFVALIVIMQYEFTEFHFTSLFQSRSVTVPDLNIDTTKVLRDASGHYKGLPSQGMDPLRPGMAGGGIQTQVVVGTQGKTGQATKIVATNISIAIGMGITFRGRAAERAKHDLGSLPLTANLIPSFCTTATAGYMYHFYLTYDFNDPYLADTKNCDTFKSYLQQKFVSLCPNINIEVHLAKVPHAGKPAWAQNDAMMEAYLDGIEYFYRINDDTVMKTPGWTEAFINQLGSYSPANVGVTGPMHAGGNTAILTYDFTHFTHFHVFGVYYPRLMTDWYADRWITDVYKPGRSTKLSHIHLVHTMSAGTRYAVNPNVGSKVVQKVTDDKVVLRRYLLYKESEAAKVAPDGSKVISMSLYGNDTRHTYGAIRNAQLIPVMFPGWLLRIYMENPYGNTKYPAVPKRILKKLTSLNVQIKFMDKTKLFIPPSNWRFLVADDLKVDFFIARNCDSRLTDRDFKAVSAWLKDDVTFHCVRDHPNHEHYKVVKGLWGGKPAALNKLFGTTIEDIMKRNTTEELKDPDYLSNSLWPFVEHHAFCHDSVSCKKHSSSYKFPVLRYGSEHLGQSFDGFGESRPEDIATLMKAQLPQECTS